MDLGSGSAFQEPADKCQPQAIEELSPEGLPKADTNKQKTKESPNDGGVGGGSPEIMSDAPQDRSQDAASVERKSGDQVKQTQREVQHEQILGQGQKRRIGVQRGPYLPEE